MLKAEVQFNQVCKQIDTLKIEINNCEDTEQNHVKILKNKLYSLEQNIENAFSELSQIESYDYLETLLNYQNKILDLGVELENKTKSESTSVSNQANIEKNGKISESKKSLVKLPALEISNFYGELESWISFKELFQSSILNDNDLSNIQKLQYLQMCVKGSNFKLICGFSFAGTKFAILLGNIMR